MTKKLDQFTRDRIVESLHLSNEKIAALTGVKVTTINRIRAASQPAPQRLPAAWEAPYNAVDTTEATIAASGRLRDAVRAMLDARARRMGCPKLDWRPFDDMRVE